MTRAGRPSQVRASYQADAARLRRLRASIALDPRLTPAQKSRITAYLKAIERTFLTTTPKT